MEEVDPERMLADLATLRRFGAEGTGVARSAFSDADIAARRWLVAEIERIGLIASIDAAGNVFGLPPGDGPCLLLGSHSDSQPLGGWLDGVYGVAAALEVARVALARQGPRVAVVSFQDEEGRFGALTGSAVWTGLRSLAEVDSMCDADGVPFAAARQRAGEIAALISPQPSDFTAFLELHIEQGPVLDRAGEAVGVVTSIVGSRQVTLHLVGEANHAGTTPMDARRDAFQAVVALASRLNADLAALAGPTTVWTIGQVMLEPNAPSIVPGRARIAVQWRDPEPERLLALREAVLRAAEEVARDRGITLEVGDSSHLPPTALDPDWIARLEAAAEQECPGRWRRLPSGALHDASNVATCLPTAMLFAASIRGISHSPEEDTAPEDLALGLRTLARAVLGPD
ncbi:MAG: M20 family metallo-hydrolase [Pseudomonadota bacterium]